MELDDFDWESCSPTRVRRGVSVSSVPKLIIVADGLRPALLAWDDLPDDTLPIILHTLLQQDKQAPRVATVKSSWARVMESCLISFCGGRHLWWSPPFEPLRPCLEGNAVHDAAARSEQAGHRHVLSC